MARSQIPQIYKYFRKWYAYPQCMGAFLSTFLVSGSSHLLCNSFAELFLNPAICLINLFVRSCSALTAFYGCEIRFNITVRTLTYNLIVIYSRLTY